MPIFLYTMGVLALTIGLAVFSYLDRVYREFGRVTTGRVHRHLETFEAEIEPRFKMERRRAAMIFNLLARLWLVLVAAVTARGVIFFVPGTWEAAVEMVFFLGAEVVIAMQFWPSVLLAGLPGELDCAAWCRWCVFSFGSSGRSNLCWSSWYRCCIFPRRNRWPKSATSRPSKRWWMRPPKRELSSRMRRGSSSRWSNSATSACAM